jgi:hypothetical protein
VGPLLRRLLALVIRDWFRYLLAFVGLL